jgi:hypothetical protein
MKLRAFLIGFGYFAFFFLGAALSRQVAHAQEECYSPDTGGDVDCCSFLSLCDCDPDEFDTCYIEPVPPPPPDWTEACLKTEPDAALWGYVDVDLDSDGNLEAWAVAYNTDGVAGQVMPTAWLKVTMPDGTVVPEVLEGTWASPMISVSVDQPFADYNDTGAGQVYGVYELHYQCGLNFNVVSQSGLSISIGNFTNSGPGGIYPGGCLFKLACPSGTTSKCAPPSVSAQGSDCDFEYDHESYLAWTPKNGTPDCFAFGLGTVSNSPGTCQ